MNEKEIEFKTLMWMRVNADYLKDKAEKEERERVEREEAERDGKPIKKRTQYKKKPKMEKVNEDEVTFHCEEDELIETLQWDEETHPIEEAE